jgi:hypothetical protein
MTSNPIGTAKRRKGATIPGSRGSTVARSNRGRDPLRSAEAGGPAESGNSPPLSPLAG